MSRPQKTKVSKNTFYIFTNGETEKIYFSSIRDEFAPLLNGRKIEIRQLKGNAYDLIQQIVKKVELCEFENNKKIWCIFDCDNKLNEESGQNTEEILRAAFKLANENKIKIGFSNMAIEYWLLSHYWYKTRSMDNKQLINELTKILGKKYNKTDEKLLKEYFIQEEQIKKAISHGKQNFQEKKRRFVEKHKKENDLAEFCQEIYKYPIWEWNSFSNLFELMQELGW